MNCNEANEFMVAVKDGEAKSGSHSFTAHLETCSSCKKMALISEVRKELVSIHSDNRVAVPPFFSAKVMAAIAERRAEPDGWAWIWQMARRTVPAMVALVVLIAVLTFGFSPDTQTPIASDATSLNSEFNSALGGDGQSSILTSSGDLSSDRVMSTVLGLGGRVSNE